METQGLPLADIRVLEFGTGYVGPVCAMRLADFGADVVKIETHRHLDFMRGQVPDLLETRPSFFDSNRNKRSILVDGSKPEGHDVLLRLVEVSDVVIENFGAGALKRLGLDYEVLRTIKPSLVMISLQGLGATAQKSITLGQNLPPLIGLTYLWNHPGAPKPVGSQLWHPDYWAGVHASSLVLAMLDHRRRTGQGHYMDAAQAELAASLLGPAYIDWTINGRVAQPQGNRGHPGAPVGCYPCRGEDAWCVIVVTTEEEWQAFTQAVGHPSWTARPEFASLNERRKHRDELDRLVAEWTSQHPPHQVMDKLQTHGVAAGAVQTIRDIMADPQLEDRGFIVTVEHELLGQVRQGGLPIRLSETPGTIRSAAPLLGQHTAEVLAEWLHLPDEEIARLQEQRVLW